MTYGIAEWYGEDIRGLTPGQRQARAQVALGQAAPPQCPFAGNICRKKSGVCSIREYPDGEPVITCPKRFEQGQILVRWLAEIVGFEIRDTLIAKEVGFTESIASESGRSAGKIDLIIARVNGGIRWYGLEVHAAYFSGRYMPQEFEQLAVNADREPPEPLDNRHPDFQSSGPRRLLPQLMIKAPTIVRWQSKIAVAVDRPFFTYLGGPSASPSQDLNDGDVIWLVPAMDGGKLTRWHWEVLTLETSQKKLLAAKTTTRNEFEAALRQKLRPISGP